LLVSISADANTSSGAASCSRTEFTRMLAIPTHHELGFRVLLYGVGPSSSTYYLHRTRRPGARRIRNTKPRSGVRVHNIYTTHRTLSRILICLAHDLFHRLLKSSPLRMAPLSCLTMRSKTRKLI